MSVPRRLKDDETEKYNKYLKSNSQMSYSVCNERVEKLISALSDPKKAFSEF